MNSNWKCHHYYPNKPIKLPERFIVRNKSVHNNSHLAIFVHTNTGAKIYQVLDPVYVRRFIYKFPIYTRKSDTTPSGEQTRSAPRGQWGARDLGKPRRLYEKPRRALGAFRGKHDVSREPLISCSNTPAATLTSSAAGPAPSRRRPIFPFTDLTLTIKSYRECR